MHDKLKATRRPFGLSLHCCCRVDNTGAINYPQPVKSTEAGQWG